VSVSLIITVSVPFIITVSVPFIVSVSVPLIVSVSVSLVITVPVPGPFGKSVNAAREFIQTPIDVLEELPQFTISALVPTAIAVAASVPVVPFPPTTFSFVFSFVFYSPLQSLDSLFHDSRHVFHPSGHEQLSRVTGHLQLATRPEQLLITPMPRP